MEVTITKGNLFMVLMLNNLANSFLKELLL